MRKNHLIEASPGNFEKPKPKEIRRGKIQKSIRIKNLGVCPLGWPDFNEGAFLTFCGTFGTDPTSPNKDRVVLIWQHRVLGH